MIRYAFLWRDEAARGLEEGGKDRPCAVILVAHGGDHEPVVTVLPVTHTPPADMRMDPLPSEGLWTNLRRRTG